MSRVTLGSCIYAEACACLLTLTLPKVHLWFSPTHHLVLDVLRDLADPVERARDGARGAIERRRVPEDSTYVGRAQLAAFPLTLYSV